MAMYLLLPSHASTHLLVVISVKQKEQAVITEKYGAHGCHVGEDGGLAPNISRQVFLLLLHRILLICPF